MRGDLIFVISVAVLNGQINPQPKERRKEHLAHQAVIMKMPSDHIKHLE
jgi:hypothetical protein